MSSTPLRLTSMRRPTTCPSKALFPSPATPGLFNILLLWSPSVSRLGDRAAAGKVAESRGAAVTPEQPDYSVPQTQDFLI
jgi:hypothetical protein